MTQPVRVRSPHGGTSPGVWTPDCDAVLERALDAALGAVDALAAEPLLRIAAIRAVADSIVAKADDLAALIVAEGGKLPQEAAAEVAYSLAFLRDAAQHAEPAPDLSMAAAGRRVEVRPYGAALLITPFNDPLAGLTRKIGPALSAGCPILLKPSPLGMLVARLLVEGLPWPARGLVQLLAVPEAARIARLAADPRVAVVSLTGSTAAGRAIAAAAAAGPKPCILELGGNCPMVVLPGADLDRAAEDAASRKVRAAGQACSAVSRVLVADEVAAPFRARLVAALAACRAGTAADAGATFGPVRTAEAVARLAALVQQAVSRGEMLRLGAHHVPSGPEDPWLVQPVLLEAPLGQSILDDAEAFGPVLSLQTFRNQAALERRLRAEPQPLAAYIYGPTERAEALARLLCFGSIGINTTAVQGADAPTGGFGAAGLGREGGRWGVEAFRAPVNIRRDGPFEASARRMLRAASVPASSSPVAQGAASTGLICVGGQMPRDAETGRIVEGVAAQALLSLDHALAVAAEAGAGPHDVLLAIVYVTDLSAKAAVNDAFRLRFGERPPARNLVVVHEIGEGATVEVGLLAVPGHTPCV